MCDRGREKVKEVKTEKKKEIKITFYVWEINSATNKDIMYL